MYIFNNVNLTKTKKLFTMKNLKKISRKNLKSINGGAEPCIQDCPEGQYKCCVRFRIPVCFNIGRACVYVSGTEL